MMLLANYAARANRATLLLDSRVVEYEDILY
jgi:hypothetical protein